MCRCLTCQANPSTGKLKLKHQHQTGRPITSIEIQNQSQWPDGPDECKDNIIRQNTITPNGNECVDIKEGSTGTIVEHNTCRNQLDTDSGCFGSRGDGNTFR